MAIDKPKEPWPGLRQELSVTKGPVSSHGAPTYTVHDPVAHRFYRLGWMEMEIISRWSLAEAEAIVKDINDNTALEITADDVEGVSRFLEKNGLVMACGPTDCARLKGLADRQKVSPFMFLVKNYLFLRLPLFKPDRFLARTLPFVKPFFSRTAILIITGAAIFGLVMVLRNLSFYMRELEALFSIEGAFMVLLAMGLSKAVHEMGHAYAAKSLGLKVPAIGVALMCFYPMLWTDTTEAWKCSRRNDRLRIGLAGVGAELTLAALASLAWLWLSPGLLKDMALTLTGVTWISTLAINANPFMRYDAYYILSDLFEMPMLQVRSFAMGKWYLRKKILGLPDDPPEPMSGQAAALSIVYAYCVWVYRFFLFLGIAFLVYHMFFKALGLLLFLVEIVWFLSLPIFQELREWYRAKERARLTVWGVALIILIISVFIPWRGSVVAPAIMDAEKIFTFHAPTGSRLNTKLPSVGQRVKAGDALLALDAPDLNFQLSSAVLNRKSLELQTATAGIASELWLRYAAQKEELTGLMSEEHSLKARLEKLVFSAPFDGEVRETAVDLDIGGWVSHKEPLLLLTGGKAVVEVMVPEEDIFRLSPGSPGKFIPTSGGVGPFYLSVISISPGTIAEITKPALSSTKGGPLPVKQGSQGELWPERAVYLIRCEVDGIKRVPASLTGWANLEGKRQSLAGRGLSYLSASLVRESGF